MEEKERKSSITDAERSINTECTVITQSTVNWSNFLFKKCSRLSVCVCVCVGPSVVSQSRCCSEKISPCNCCFFDRNCNFTQLITVEAPKYHNQSSTVAFISFFFTFRLKDLLSRVWHFRQRTFLLFLLWFASELSKNFLLLKTHWTKFNPTWTAFTQHSIHIHFTINDDISKRIQSKHKRFPGLCRCQCFFFFFHRWDYRDALLIRQKMQTFFPPSCVCA